MKTSNIILRVSESEKARLMRAAARKHLTLSGYMFYCVYTTEELKKGSLKRILTKQK